MREAARPVALIALAVTFFMLVPFLGCTYTGPVSAQQRLVEACHTYASTLDVLATHRRLGTLTQGQIQSVDTIRLGVNPICAGDLTDPTFNHLTALRSVEAALEELVLIRQGAAQ